LSEILKDIASSVGGSIEIGYGGSEAVSTSIALFKAIRIDLESVVRRLSKGRRIIIVVDEVRVDGDELLSSFRVCLEVFSNEIGYANLSYRDRTGGSITVAALVSDALVTEIRHVVKAKVNWILIWNLSKRAVEELAENLRIGIDVDILWRLTGGNPRALQVIAIQGLEKWFKEEILKNLHNLYRETLEILGDREALWREFEVAIQNIDEARLSLIRSMMRRDIAIYIGAATHLSELPSNEPWIREDYAYQIPAYYYTLKTMVNRRSIDITLNNVLSNL